MEQENEGMTKRIRICCDAMGDAMMMNDIREGIIIDEDGAFIWWKDGDTMPMNYCPNCGKKMSNSSEKG